MFVLEPQYILAAFELAIGNPRQREQGQERAVRKDGELYVQNRGSDRKKKASASSGILAKSFPQQEHGVRAVAAGESRKDLLENVERFEQ